MDYLSDLNKAGISKNIIKTTDKDRKDLVSIGTRYNPVIMDLVVEGGEDFFHYLKYLNLVHESEIMMLSPRHHYYFEYHDLIGVKVLINISKLNQVKNLRSFLSTVYRLLPPESKFIGCFSESRIQNGTGFSPPVRILNKFINFLDSRTERDLDNKDVSKLLETNGFILVDMTEINGITYFTTIIQGEQRK
jgi:hypothetical protein